MSKLAVIILLLLVALPCFAKQLKLSAEQKQIWEMEERYWQIVEAGDGEAYISQWDENFVGWPDNCLAPIRKDVIRSDTFGTLRDMKNFQLDPKAVQVFENVAIAYYLVTAMYTPKGGSNEVVAFRISHTWRKTNGVWHIIGGMSSPAQPSK